MSPTTINDEDIQLQIQQGIELRAGVLGNLDDIKQAASTILDAIREGRIIYAAGNGGSAADAQHFIAELSGKFYKHRRPLPGIALTTNTSQITAIGNDYSYDEVFSRPLEGLVKAGDVFVGISTSGNSPNVVRAAEVAQKAGARVIALVGMPGSKLAQIGDVVLSVPSKDVARIQEVHLLYYHLIAFLVEAAIA